jgi:peptidoglycan/LPS O-acetylase OafA/YrhL
LKTLDKKKASGHIPALDGVRGFAAASVFLVHYGGGSHSHFLPIRMAAETLQLGWAGVSLFFVLSGFLITGILWDGFHKEHWWRNFYIRRSLRIFPLYYCALFIALLVALTVDSGSRSLPSLLVYAFYLQNIPPLAIHLRQLPHVWIDHFWSLAVEEQFYIIWPFLLFAVHKRDRKYALGLCASGWILSLAFRIAAIAFHFPIGWAMGFLVSRSGELCAGGFLAIAIRGTISQRERTLRRVPAILGGSAIALVLVLALSRSPAPENPWMATIGFSVLSILFAGIVAACLYSNPIRSFFSNSFLRWLGKISYGVYVYHLFFRPEFKLIAGHLAPHASQDTAQVLTAIVAALGTLAIANLSFYTYEQFFLRMKDKFAVSRPVKSQTI